MFIRKNKGICCPSFKATWKHKGELPNDGQAPVNQDYMEQEQMTSSAGTDVSP